MIARLTSEQIQALHENGKRPTPVVDPNTNERYVLVSQERFEQLQTILQESPLTRAEQRELLRELGKRAYWDDPEMDAYDDYDSNLSARS